MVKKKKIVAAWFLDCRCQKLSYLATASDCYVVPRDCPPHSRYCLLGLLAEFDRDYEPEWVVEMTQDEADAALRNLLAQQDYVVRF